MKIKVTNHSLTKLINIRISDIFLYNGRHYMRIMRALGQSIDHNAVDIDDGHLYHIDDNALVSAKNATLHIED